jgi:hypothetical protein
VTLTLRGSKYEGGYVVFLEPGKNVFWGPGSGSMAGARVGLGFYGESHRFWQPCLDVSLTCNSLAAAWDRSRLVHVRVTEAICRGKYTIRNAKTLLLFMSVFMLSRKRIFSLQVKSHDRCTQV